MPPDNEPLEPTPFDAARPAPAPTQQAPARNAGAPWVLPALGVLLLLAALVVFWLPGQLSPQQPPQKPVATSIPTAQPTATSSGNSKPAAAAPQTSPWSDAQQARLRKEAQNVLQELLDIQFELEEHGVTQWAAQRFEQVAVLAADADELYRNRQFQQATEGYQAALAQLQSLRQDMPQELQRQLQQARQAIEQGDAESATAALDMAALIDPDSADVVGLRQRTELLPQLLPLLAQAAQAETAGDLAQAEQLLQQAVAMDPLHQQAAAELQRVATAAREQAFNAAMSEGYSALDENRFDHASQAFRSAAKIQPGSGEAASALLEVKNAQSAAGLASLRQQGKMHEQQERWQQAVDAYQRAQLIDASVLFAAQGLERSSARARLDQQLRAVIEDAQRLSDARVAEKTEQLLQQARAVSPRGQLLQSQIDQLDSLLRLANTPLHVTLHSDLETEVIVYKVARLGKFQSRQLTLRPGEYTAVGRRNGYRDIRQTFTVSHQRHPQPVTIICREPI